MNNNVFYAIVFVVISVAYGSDVITGVQNQSMDGVSITRILMCLFVVISMTVRSYQTKDIWQLLVNGVGVVFYMIQLVLRFVYK